jgi:hypothetical protein
MKIVIAARETVDLRIKADQSQYKKAKIRPLQSVVIIDII